MGRGWNSLEERGKAEHTMIITLNSFFKNLFITACSILKRESDGAPG